MLKDYLTALGETVHVGKARLEERDKMDKCVLRPLLHAHARLRAVVVLKGPAIAAA
jgi:hypothetical protein